MLKKYECDEGFRWSSKRWKRSWMKYKMERKYKIIGIGILGYLF